MRACRCGNDDTNCHGAPQTAVGGLSVLHVHPYTFIAINMWQRLVGLPVDKHIKLSVIVRLLLTDFDRNGNGQAKLGDNRLHQIYVAVPKLFQKDRQ